MMADFLNAIKAKFGIKFITVTAGGNVIYKKGI